MSWSRERDLLDLKIVPKQEITTGTGHDILCRMWGLLNPDKGRVWNMRIADAAKIAASDLCRFHNDLGVDTMQKVRLLKQTILYCLTQVHVERKILELYGEFKLLCDVGEPRRTDRWVANRYKPFFDKCQKKMNVNAGAKKPKKVGFYFQKRFLLLSIHFVNFSN